MCAAGARGVRAARSKVDARVRALQILWEPTSLRRGAEADAVHDAGRGGARGTAPDLRARRSRLYREGARGASRAALARDAVLADGDRAEDRWKAWEPITRRDNDRWQSDVDRARRLVEHLGKRRAAKLTRKDVEEYRQKRFSETTRRGAAPAPGTIDREVALLKRCLNYAVECGVLVRTRSRASRS
jgi:hypothetical protein